MAAAGVGTGSSPDAALGGQEVTQGHGCTGGFNTARGMTRAPAAAAAEAGPQSPRHRGTGVLQKPGPAAEWAAGGSAAEAERLPGTPQRGTLQSSPCPGQPGGRSRRPWPRRSCRGAPEATPRSAPQRDWDGGGLLCPRRAKNTKAAGRQRAPGGTVRSGARAAAWEAMATSRPRDAAVTAAPTAGVAHVGLRRARPAARARCARGTERGRRRLPPVTEGK